jgi:transposase
MGNTMGNGDETMTARKKVHKFREYDPTQGNLFGTWDPEGLLAADDPARLVEATVENMDFSRVEGCYSKRGSKAYDPRLLMKLLLLGYFESVFSSRQLMRRCSRDAAYVYLCRGQQPDFRTISDFRRRHREAFEEQFLHLVQVARCLGMARLGHVTVDSTPMRANGGQKATRSVEDVKEELKGLREYLKKVEETDREEDIRYGEGRSGDEWAEDAKTPEERRKKVREAVEAVRKEQETSSEGEKQCRQVTVEKTRPEHRDRERKRQRAEHLEKVVKEAEDRGLKKVNVTDPESGPTADRRFKARYPGYAWHAVVSEDRLIVETSVGYTGCDGDHLDPLLEAVEKDYGEKPADIFADSGYSGAKALEACEEREVTPYIPDRALASSINTHTPMKEPDPYSKENFQYDPERRGYICPQGEFLPWRSRHVERSDGRERERHRYHNREACRNCPVREECCTNGKYRDLRDNGVQHLVDAARARLMDEEGGNRYRKTRKGIEHIFGHFKGNLGLRQLRLRGRRGAETELILAAMVTNLRKMWNRAWNNIDETVTVPALIQALGG